MSNVLNKKALAEKIAEKCELSKKQSEAIVNTVFDEIKATLEEKSNFRRKRNCRYLWFW